MGNGFRRTTARQPGEAASERAAAWVCNHEKPKSAESKPQLLSGANGTPFPSGWAKPQINWPAPAWKPLLVFGFAFFWFWSLVFMRR
jgi:hypothetical protein